MYIQCVLVHLAAVLPLLRRVVVNAAPPVLVASARLVVPLVVAAVVPAVSFKMVDEARPFLCQIK